MAELACVPPDRVAQIWSSICGPLRKACERGSDVGSFGDLAHDVLNGNALVWLAFDDKPIGVGVTRIEMRGSNRICMILAYASLGKGDWLHLVGTIEQYARDEGCTAVRLCGRKGWKRVLQGYREPYVVLEKAI